MAILRGQELIRHLQNNPSASYRIIKGGELLGLPNNQWVGGQRPGGLGGLVSSMLSPFTKITDLANYANVSLAGEKGEFLPQYGYSPAEFEEARKRGLGQEWLKSGAGIAAYAVPGAGAFGGGLRGALASGALAGGLGGVSMTEDITDPEQLLRGAGIGALTGAGASGALYGLGNLLSRAKGGNQYQGKWITEPTEGVEQISLSGVTDASALTSRQRNGIMRQLKAAGLERPISATENINDFIKLRNALELAGVPVGNTPQDVLENTYKALKPIGKMKDAGLSEIGTLTIGDVQTILGGLDDFINQSGTPVRLKTSKAYKDVLSALFNLGDNPTAESVDNLARNWRNQVNYQTQRAFPISSEIYDNAADSAISVLKDLSRTLGTGQYATAKEKFTSILGARGSKVLEQSAKKVSRQGIRSAFLGGITIPLPTETVPRTLQAAYGRFQEGGLGNIGGGGGGTGGGGLLSSVGSKVGELPVGKFGGLLQSPAAQYLVPRMASFATTGPREESGATQMTGLGGVGVGTESDIPNMLSALPSQPGMAQASSGGLGGSQINGQVLAAMVLSGMIDPTAAKTAMDLVGGSQGGVNLSATMQRDLWGLGTAENSLAEIEQMVRSIGLKEGGLAARVTGGVRSGLGKLGLDLPADLFNDVRQSVSARMARALGEVGVLTDLDVQRVLAAIPTLSDSQWEAEQKLAFIKRLLEGSRQSLISAGSMGGGSGADVSGLEDLAGGLY